jgi:hypothetical protein
MTQVTLPSFRRFTFRGTSAYFEDLVAQINAPVLSKLTIDFLRQFTFTVPHLLQFMRTSENLSLRAIRLHFSRDHRAFSLGTEYLESALFLRVIFEHIAWQVSSAVPIVSGLQPVLSAVEQLTFSREVHNRSPEWHDEVDWCELLRLFNNVQTLRVQDELVGKISCSLESDNGEHLPT